MKSILLFSTLVLFVSCSGVISCGNEKSESEKKQDEINKSQYVDSIRNSVIEQERKKSELTNEMNIILYQIQGTLDRIRNNEVELVVQEEKYESLKLPKLLRTPEERDQQLREQLYLLEELKSQLENEKEEVVKKGKKLNQIRVKLGLPKLRENEIREMSDTISPPVDINFEIEN